MNRRIKSYTGLVLLEYALCMLLSFVLIVGSVLHMAQDDGSALGFSRYLTGGALLAVVFLVVGGFTLSCYYLPALIIAKLVYDAVPARLHWLNPVLYGVIAISFIAHLSLSGIAVNEAPSTPLFLFLLAMIPFVTLLISYYLFLPRFRLRPAADARPDGPRSDAP